MRCLVNALSLGSLSGQHVLFGHLGQMASWDDSQHEFLVIHHPTLAHPAWLDRPNIRWLPANDAPDHWLWRSTWESQSLPSLMRRERVSVYFTPSGTVLPRSPAAQVSLAQNPWCMMPMLHHRWTDKAKAKLQRIAYRRAYRQADLMVYNSRHMEQLYRQNDRGEREGRWIIAYQGINDEAFAAAESWRGKVERLPLRILAVSVMAAWKGIETLVRAVDLLRRRGIQAELNLVGPWADSAYEHRIRQDIESLGLQGAVTITGKVSVDELHRQYASARVFCLMSKCESFGIPAIEAQTFGTPVVGCQVCAMPEISGAGGVYGPPDDPAATADLLEPLLTDDVAWQRLSEAALVNVERFRWEHCSLPLKAMLELSPASAPDPVAVSC